MNKRSNVKRNIVLLVLLVCAIPLWIDTYFGVQAERYASKKLYPKAVSFAEKRISLRKQVLGAKSQYTLCTTEEMGQIYYNYGDIIQAKEIFESTYGIRKEKSQFSDFHGKLLLYNLGSLYQKLGYYNEAEKKYQQSYSASKDINDRSTSLSYLFLLYLEMDEFEKAKTIFDNSDFVYKTNLDKDPFTSVYLLGLYYESKKEYSKAEKLYAWLLNKTKNMSQFDRCYAKANLARSYYKQGEFDEAAKLYQEIASFFQDTNYALGINANMHLALIYKQDKMLAGANQILDNTINAKNKILYKTHPDLICLNYYGYLIGRPKQEKTEEMLHYAESNLDLLKINKDRKFNGTLKSFCSLDRRGFEQ